jgi:anti-anti-sigma factor
MTQHGVQALEPELERALPDGTRAVINIGDVDLITTPGIALILSATQRLRRTGGRVVFTAARPTVRDLLHRCRLDEVLEIEQDEPVALERARH